MFAKNHKSSYLYEYVLVLTTYLHCIDYNTNNLLVSKIINLKINIYWPYFTPAFIIRNPLSIYLKKPLFIYLSHYLYFRFEEYLLQQRELFAEEEIRTSFPKLISFVLQTEKLMTDNNKSGGASVQTGIHSYIHLLTIIPNLF